MKISICIPQYNRIQYLLKNLSILEKQEYDEIEIIISDDASSDDTEKQIAELKKNYRFPITYSRFEKNAGYDRNYRRSLELATGDYCILLGNDDTLSRPDAIAYLVNVIKENNFPDLGFCNYTDDGSSSIFERAMQTGVIGAGPQIALTYYSCFSFVGGIIYKRSAFEKYNSARFDGSIFSQIALNCFMICNGCTLFSIKEPLVIKDIKIDGSMANSYRDTIARKWKDYKRVDGGLPSIVSVLFRVCEETSNLTRQNSYSIFKRIYSKTLPHWILDYKYNNALPEAVGIFTGMRPWYLPEFKKLAAADRTKILGYYYSASFAAFAAPSKLFNKFKSSIYAYYKRKMVR